MGNQQERGTFPLADDGEDDATEELLKILDKFNLSKDVFILLEEGHGRIFK